jgi:hypothetical protein
MSSAYGSAAPPGYGADVTRNRMAEVMAAMQKVQRPPGGLSTPGIPGLPELGPQGLQGLQGPGAVTNMAPSMAMGGMPGAVSLPGAPPAPGQLPFGMSPQAAAGGAAPPMPMPPRY